MAATDRFQRRTAVALPDHRGTPDWKETGEWDIDRLDRQQIVAGLSD
jgi:hypothetical protein